MTIKSRFHVGGAVAHAARDEDDVDIDDDDDDDDDGKTPAYGINKTIFGGCRKILTSELKKAEGDSSKFLPANDCISWS